MLAKFTGKPFQPDATDEGSVFKINMLLRKLPTLKAKKYPAAEAWCGTFHSDEGYEQMNLSYEQAAQGRLPDKTPCEVYCHTLTDNSILSPDLFEQGYHTMTLFGLDAPWSLFARDNRTVRKEAEKKFLASINQWLEEPLEDCLAVGRDGALCLESKSPVDIEDSLGMFHGNIFHDAPTWPFATAKTKRGPGASRPNTRMSFSADRARNVAAPSVAFPGTTRRARFWRRSRHKAKHRTSTPNIQC